MSRMLNRIKYEIREIFALIKYAVIYDVKSAYRLWRVARLTRKTGTFVWFDGVENVQSTKEYNEEEKE